MMSRTRAAAVAVVWLAWMGQPLVAQEPPLRVHVGTIVPTGTLWYERLEYIAQEWRRRLGPRLDMKIIANGQLGDESDLVLKARGGTLDAVGLSSVGLSRIDDGVSCLQVPMMFASYDELDYVRDRIAPELERRIEAKGFKVLHWADGGWVYAFAKKPVKTPDDLRHMKLLTSAGDPDTETLYKSLGFRVVPLSPADMTTFLQRGTVDAFVIVPLFAQLNRSYLLAPYMTNIRWTPLVGGTVITTRAWERLPEADRPALLKSARTAGDSLRGDIRRLGEESVVEMQKRGLHVVDVEEATRRLWQTEAEKAYPKMRDVICPGDVFDRVTRLRDEFRATRPAHSTGGR
jgi:TRAP-type transport system periplasmic protein